MTTETTKEVAEERTGKTVRKPVAPQKMELTVDYRTREYLGYSKMKLVLAPEKGEVFDRVARSRAVAYNAMVDVFTADSSIYHAMKRILEDRLAAKKQAEKDRDEQIFKETGKKPKRKKKSKEEKDEDKITVNAGSYRTLTVEDAPTFEAYALAHFYKSITTYHVTVNGERVKDGFHYHDSYLKNKEEIEAKPGHAWEVQTNEERWKVSLWILRLFLAKMRQEILGTNETEAMSVPMFDDFIPVGEKTALSINVKAAEVLWKCVGKFSSKQSLESIYRALFKDNYYPYVDVPNYGKYIISAAAACSKAADNFFAGRSKPPSKKSPSDAKTITNSAVGNPSELLKFEDGKVFIHLAGFGWSEIAKSPAADRFVGMYQRQKGNQGFFSTVVKNQPTEKSCHLTVPLISITRKGKNYYELSVNIGFFDENRYQRKIKKVKNPEVIGVDRGARLNNAMTTNVVLNERYHNIVEDGVIVDRKPIVQAHGHDLSIATARSKNLERRLKAVQKDISEREKKHRAAMEAHKETCSKFHGRKRKFCGDAHGQACLGATCTHWCPGISESAALRRLRRHYTYLSGKKTVVKDQAISQIAHSITRQASVVVIEDLNVKGMLKKPKAKTEEDESGNVKFVPNGRAAKKAVSRMISGASFYKMEQAITSAAKKNGADVWKAHQFFPSSQVCSECDTLVGKMRGKTFTCSNCGATMDRDNNAARNLATEYTRNHDKTDEETVWYINNMNP